MRQTGVLVMALLALFLDGCAQAPVPTTYPYSEQKKMQAAHHWQVLAEDVAQQLAQRLENVDLGGRRVSVEFHEDTPFNKGFRNMLLTQLVQRGVPVSASFHAENLRVVYETQVVYHRDKRLTRTYPGLLTSTVTYLATGVWVIRDAFLYGSSDARFLAVAGAAVATAAAADALSGAFAGELPNSEVIITASLLEGEDFLTRKTDVYYVNNEDYWHYQLPRQEKAVHVSDGQ